MVNRDMVVVTKNGRRVTFRKDDIKSIEYYPDCVKISLGGDDGALFPMAAITMIVPEEYLEQEDD